MKAVLLLLIALLLVITAQMREGTTKNSINPTDELIDQSLLHEHTEESAE